MNKGIYVAKVGLNNDIGQDYSGSADKISESIEVATKGFNKDTGESIDILLTDINCTIFDLTIIVPLVGKLGNRLSSKEVSDKITSCLAKVFIYNVFKTISYKGTMRIIQIIKLHEVGLLDDYTAGVSNADFSCTLPIDKFQQLYLVRESKKKGLTQSEFLYTIIKQYQKSHSIQN